MNVYAYAASNPIRNTDLFGLFCGGMCDDLNNNGIPDDSPAENTQLPDGSSCNITGTCRTLEEMASESQDCLSCNVVCIAEVVGISVVQDQAVTRFLKQLAKATAKEAIKNAIPGYTIASTINTVWGIVNCTVECSK